MSALQALRSQKLPTIRTFTTSTRYLAGSKPPPGNQPPGQKLAGKPGHLADDPQSSASTQETQGGDDHPAKQPDPQKEVDRSTGFENVDGEIKGGKESLGQRSDKK